MCILHANTLEAAKYHLKHLFKVSEDHYQHSTLIPIYGNGQGSANSPAVWLFISNVLFKCQHYHGHGTVYTDPANTIKTRICVVGFVDDTTIYVNNFYQKHTSVERLVTILCNDTQLCRNLLWTTGGELES